MTHSRNTPTGDRALEPMLALARCSQQHRIVVAGSKGVELMLELHRRGYSHAAATANCGLPAGQYDAVLVDWRRRTLKALDTMLDWLAELMCSGGVLVVWVDPQKPAANQALRRLLEEHGFMVEEGIVHECGCAFSARRHEINPLRKAA
jgi:hypothetical protein